MDYLFQSLRRIVYVVKQIVCNGSLKLVTVRSIIVWAFSLVLVSCGPLLEQVDKTYPTYQAAVDANALHENSFCPFGPCRPWLSYNTHGARYGRVTN